MKALLIILALAWAGLFLCVPSRPGNASTTARALSVVCPGNERLAGYVDEAARRYMVPRLTLVAQMWRESRCDTMAVGKLGERGLLQLHGVAARGLTRKQLHDPRINLMAGARWLSLREVDCKGQLAGLVGYPARTCGSKGGKRYARRVLATVARIRRAMEVRR